MAEGRFDGYYEYGLNPWDTCGAVAVIQEAGGKVSTTNGDEYSAYFSNTDISLPFKSLEEMGLVGACVWQV